MGNVAEQILVEIFCLFLNDFCFFLFQLLIIFRILYCYSQIATRNKRIIMKMKQSNLVLFALAFVVIFTAETFACSCLPSHPQTSYCNSDFGEFIILKIKLIYRFFNCMFLLNPPQLLLLEF